MNDKPTFVCVDCGYDVYVFGYHSPEQIRCSTCQWIADIPDPVERERLREFLGESHG
jgi:hypothetical protein